MKVFRFLLPIQVAKRLIQTGELVAKCMSQFRFCRILCADRWNAKNDNSDEENDREHSDGHRFRESAGSLTACAPHHPRLKHAARKNAVYSSRNGSWRRENNRDFNGSAGAGYSSGFGALPGGAMRSRRGPSAYHPVHGSPVNSPSSIADIGAEGSVPRRWRENRRRDNVQRQQAFVFADPVDRAITIR